MAGILQIVVGLAIAYLGLALILRLFFRRIFYRPWRWLADPAKSDVDGIELVDIHPATDQHLYLWHKAPEVHGAPVLIFLDGVRGNLSVWNRRWRRIHAAGAGFVALSYRGYGGSTGTPSEPGFHQDAYAAWRWAEERYGKAPLVIHGYSMGAAVAARLAAAVQEAPLVLEGAPLSIRKSFRRVLPFVFVGISIRDTLHVDRWIPMIKAPLLLVHGSKDVIVPPRASKALHRLAQEPKRLEIIEGANHTNLTINGLYPLIWSFLDYKPPEPYADQVYTEEETKDAGGMDPDLEIIPRLPPRKMLRSGNALHTPHRQGYWPARPQAKTKPTKTSRAA